MQSYCRILVAAIIILATISYMSACSCMPTHPQQQYCNADFVILARVKRSFLINNDTRVYKTRIRKEYKMTEKAVVALKSGRLLTPKDDSMCGIHLEVGKLYALSGKILTLKAHLNLCGLAERWDTISKRQRKGLKRMYQHGCTCNIKFCPRHRKCPRTRDSCNWVSWHPNQTLDCERTQGICLRSASKQCIWGKNKAQIACMKNHTRTENHLPSPYGRDRMFVQ